MKDFILNMFSETGNVSMTRVMSLIVCITACYIAFKKGSEDLGVVTVLLTTAFGAKVMQKSIEVKNVDRK